MEEVGEAAQAIYELENLSEDQFSGPSHYKNELEQHIANVVEELTHSAAVAQAVLEMLFRQGKIKEPGKTLYRRSKATGYLVPQRNWEGRTLYGKVYEIED